MSDWEDEYDEAGHAIQKPTPKLAPTEWKSAGGDYSKGNVYFGVRRGASFGAPREEGRADRGSGDSGFVSRRGERDQGGTSRNRRTVSNEKSHFSQPVTIRLENAFVGRVIGT